MALNGVGSINVDSVVSSLMAAEKKKIAPTTALKNYTDVKISNMGDFSSKMDTMKSSATPLSSDDVYTTTDKAKAAISAFVTSYNTFVTKTNELTGYNTSAKKAGPLNGNQSVRSAVNQIKDAVYKTDNAGIYDKMYEVGISLQKDGTLKIDTTKLDNALSSNPNDVKELMKKVSSNISDAVDSGITKVTASKQTLSTQSEALQTKIDKFNDKLSNVETNYRRQFTGIAAAISKYNDIASMF